ncbi:hypothetical protein BDF19DRAFT_450453 [Syncephalis fuscata]|nr:hypothetical protein BDF19DRAFT_450453 [Syncephalis fuscata]
MLKYFSALLVIILMLSTAIGASTLTVNNDLRNYNASTEQCVNNMGCMFCTLQVPTCQPECGEDSICEVTPQTCCQCATAHCKPKNKYKPCINCLWRPTCDRVRCRGGTHCVEVAPTCHSCGSANCVPN